MIFSVAIKPYIIPDRKRAKPCRRYQDVRQGRGESMQKCYAADCRKNLSGRLRVFNQQLYTRHTVELVRV